MRHFRRVLVLGLLVSLAQCGGEGTTQPPPPPPPPPPENVPPLSDETQQTMCALSELARMLASTQQQNSSSISSQQDCKVSDVPEVLETNPQSTGFFESLYLETDRDQQVDFTASAGFDAAMALFQVIAPQSASVDPGGVGPLVRSSQAGRAETLTLLGSNDDRSPTDPNPRILTTIRPGVGYLVVVSGFDASATGGYTLTMDPVTPSEPPPPPAPRPGAIRISNTTTGTPDPDGYTVVVSGRKSKALAVNGQVDFTNLAPGDYSVELQGVAPTCAVISQNPQTASVSSNTTSSVRFDVNCQVAAQTGDLSVRTRTTGGAPDPDGYTVRVDGSQSQSIGNNATVTFTGLSEGTHTVRLSGLASNCRVINGSNPRDVTVTAGQAAQTTFDVDCPTTPGDLQVTTITTPANGDPDGYTVTVDGSLSQSIGNNATVTFTQLTPGSHSVQLTGIAATCTVVNGSNPRNVTVISGQTVQTTFDVNCQTPPGDLQVSTSTTGSNPDPDGYTVTVDGSLSQSIGNNATVTFTQLTPGSHSVQLTGLASNCSVINGTNPRNVTVISGQTAQTTFDVDCPGSVAPTISNFQTKLIQLNAAQFCGHQSPPGSHFEFEWDYSDPDGDVTPSGTTIEVKYAFSDGTSGTAGGLNYQFTGDGFSGTITATNVCILFAGTTWVDETVTIWDAANNKSNSLTRRINRPAGANSVIPGGPELRPSASGPPDPP